MRRITQYAFFLMNSFFVFCNSLRVESNKGLTNYLVKIFATVVRAMRTSDGSLLAKSFCKVATNKRIIGESS